MLALAACALAPRPAKLDAQAAHDLSPAEIATRATPATATIVTFSASGDTLGQGSGFLVRGSGVIVTNWHVIAGANAATVILASGERYTRVLYLDGDSTRDVALLQIPALGARYLPIRQDIPSPGSRVVVIGSPLGLDRTVTDGVVSAKRLVQGVELVQVSAPISHGSSGGPVLDSRGRVFAIASASLSQGQQLNFAVPVRYAMGLLELHPTPISLAASPAALAQTATDTQTAAAATPRIWAPSRATTPRPTLSGTYSVFRWMQSTSSNGVKQSPTTAIDLLVIVDDLHGDGLLGLYCDSLYSCNGADPITAHTAPSGDVIVDLGFGALDGYQTDSGFLAHGQYTPSTGGLQEVWIRTWRFSPRLSRRSGLYSCRVRTQYIDGRFHGDFTDWTGQAAALETSDSLYLEVYLTNSSGGITGGYFPVRSGNEIDARLSRKDQELRLHGTWSFGRLSADWEDRRAGGGQFVGRLDCNRQ